MILALQAQLQEAIAAKDAAQGKPASGPSPAVTPQHKIIPAASPVITPSQRIPTPSSSSRSVLATPPSGKVRNLYYENRFYHPNGLVKCFTFFPPSLYMPPFKFERFPPNQVRPQKSEEQRMAALADGRLRRLCEVKPSGKIKVPQEVHDAWKSGGYSRQSLMDLFLQCGMDEVW